MSERLFLDDFKREMETKGWVHFDNVIALSELDQLKRDLKTAYAIRRQVQIDNGIDQDTEGTFHHLLGDGDSFLNLLKNRPLDTYIRSFFGSNYILNSFGGVTVLKSKSSYASRAHRDVRTFTREIKLMLNFLLMLDDFTLENGATYLLSGSHLEDRKPEDDQFYENADRAVGKAGSIVLFDSNLWHASGKNETDSSRSAITLTFSKPFMKPQFDYPRYLGYEFGVTLPDDLKQIIGYNSRIPAKLDEWYQPRETRFYKPDQG